MKKWWGWGDVGKEYDLSNKPDFYPFLEKSLGFTLQQEYKPVSLKAIELPPCRLDNEIIEKISNIVGSDNTSHDNYERLIHAYGKSYRDLIRIRKGQIESAPDLVVFPFSHEQVLQILQLAGESGFKVIPFGGGTSVVGGVEAINLSRAVCLDLKNMNKLLELDRKSGLATFQAGIFGPELEKQLNEKGYTLSHFPQSFEFSTLGGWAVTRSAGQQSSKYGKIEKMITALKLAMPTGELETLKLPAKANGPDLNQIIIGSEGIYGVVTEVTVKVHKLPECRDYRGYLFENYHDGLHFIRKLIQDTGIYPATVRLSDPTETKLLFKLSEKHASFLKDKVSSLVKTYMQEVKSFDFENPSFLLLGFEGKSDTVDFYHQKTAHEMKDYKVLKLGKSIGDKWYESRFDLPYLRDTLLDKGVMVDTLETSTIWENIPTLYKAVQHALQQGITTTGFLGLVACHVSHVYHEGASLYYTFAAPQDHGNELEQWQTIKDMASEAIVGHQGTISHHHGIGADHARWLPREIGSKGMEIIDSIKVKLDPDNIMNPQNLLRPTR